MAKANKDKPSHPSHSTPKNAHDDSHDSHGNICGLKDYSTYIACQNGCGALVAFPSDLTGERAYFCAPCWDKRGRMTPMSGDVRL